MSTGGSRKTNTKAAARQARNTAGSRAGAESRTAGKRTAKTASGSRTSTRTGQEILESGAGLSAPVRREVSLLLAFAAVVLLMLGVFGAGGVVGSYIRAFLFGLTGVLAYVLPLCIGAAIWYGLSSRFPHVARNKIIAGFVAFAALDGMISRIYDMPPIGVTPIGEFYIDASAYFRGGGLIGGLLSTALSPLGFAGTLVVEIVLLLICLVLMTGQTIRSCVMAGRRRARVKAEAVAKEREDYQAYTDRRAEERYQERMRSRASQRENAGQSWAGPEGTAQSAMRSANLNRTVDMSGGEAAIDHNPEGVDGGLVYDKNDTGAAARRATLAAMRERNRRLKPTRQEKRAKKQAERLKNERLKELGRKRTGYARADILPPPQPLDQDMHELQAEDGVGDRILKSRGFADGPIPNAGTVHTAGTTESAGKVPDVPENGAIPQQEYAQENVLASTPEEAREQEAAFASMPGTSEMAADEGAAGGQEMIGEETPGSLLKTDYSTPISTDASVAAAGAKAAAAVGQTGREAKKIAAAAAAAGKAEAMKEAEEGAAKKQKPYVFPPMSLLNAGRAGASRQQALENQATARKLQETLRTFGVQATITNIACGPAVTRYEIQPEMGVKVSKIVSLSDDIKLNLAASDIRIEAPIPGKAAIGIEVPNKKASAVMIRDIFESDVFRAAKSPIAFAVGKDLGGKPVVADIAKMPHLLIAGATGSGKSVCINSIIVSILYHATPQQVRMILIDPKVVELNVYSGIPHLLLPVVTDPKKASGALNWAVAQMDDRYRKFARAGAKNLADYNAKVPSLPPDKDGKQPEKLPQLLIVIDELADLMMVAPGEVEQAIIRLAQLARAAGIHLVIATQRPSVNVITGLIKANVPSRIAFAVSSGVDSRTIIDMNGAEKLLGKGDMLFFPTGFPKPKRVQGTFVSDEEVTRIVDFVCEHNTAEDARESQKEVEQAVSEAIHSPDDKRSEVDELFADAGHFLIKNDHASTGSLQRNFRIGFNRAGRIMDQLAAAGVVTQGNGTKAREVLMSEEQFNEYLKNQNAE